MTGDNHIIRTVKDRANPYVMIARALFDNTRLSIEARGTMGYLLSKPDNWQVRMSDLQRATGVGRDQLRRILKELAAEGYLHRERTHGADGRWEWVSVVYETPSTENPSMAYPSLVQPSMENTSIYQVTSVANNELNDNEGSGPGQIIRDAPPFGSPEYPAWAMQLEERRRRQSGA